MSHNVLEDIMQNSTDMPQSRRLIIYVCNERWQTGLPRLLLTNFVEKGEAPYDILEITVDSETFFAKRWPNRHGRGRGRQPRLGTWDRYRYEVAWLGDFLQQLGWQLDDREQALLNALEAYQPLRRVA